MAVLKQRRRDKFLIANKSPLFFEAPAAASFEVLLRRRDDERSILVHKTLNMRLEEIKIKKCCLLLMV